MGEIPMSTQTISILGGTGLVGQRVVQTALARGYRLRVLARTPEKVPLHDQITAVKGDARDPVALSQLLEGSSAVVSTLGPSGINTSLRMARKSARELPCYNSTKTLLPLMKQAGIERFILTGGASLKTPEDNNGWFMHFMLTKFAPLILGPLCDDRQQEYELLRASSLDWTIPRCPSMSPAAPTGAIKANTSRFQGGKVSIEQLAGFLVEQVSATSFSRRAVYVAS